MPDFPVLETERLILRCPEAADLDGFAELMADADAARFIGGQQSRDQCWRILNLLVGAWVTQGFSMFSVVEKASGRWIGRIGPWRPEGWPGPEIAYGLNRSAWGQGYAAEAIEASIGFAFDRLGWDEVIHTIDPRNAASKAAATRVGSRYLRQDRLPDPFDLEIEVWEKSREAWLARRG